MSRGSRWRSHACSSADMPKGKTRGGVVAEVIGLVVEVPEVQSVLSSTTKPELKFTVQ